jgi:Fe-S-cluster-containing dehydrogenase component
MEEKDDKNPDNKKQSRRKFIQNVGLIAGGAVAGGAAIYAGLDLEKRKLPFGERLKLLAADGKLVEVDSAYVEQSPKLVEALLQLEGREGLPGHKWVMIIDLSKCRNARKCIDACQAAHHLRPEQYHINTLQMKDSPLTASYHMPKPCQHCDNPPCVSVCPVDATFKRPDGPVLIDNERCIGCRFCIAACPYSARVFNWFDPKDAEKDKGVLYNIELNVPQKKGTITKCLFSSDRLREGKLPYCVAACPNGVYWFGDEMEDAVTNGTTKETTSLSELLKINAGYQLMPELGTKPRVYYLPPKNRIFQFEEGLKDEQKG